VSHELVAQPSTMDFLEKFWKQAPKDVVKIHQSMRIAHETKFVTLEFDPRKFKTIELLHITDVQFGHLMCDKRKVVEYRDWVLSEPNRFVLFGGDMIDAATAISIASPYENDVEPQGQVFNFCELMQPMRHRILGYVGGNHERRGAKTFGDLGRIIATLLKVPYSAGRQFIDIKYGEHDPFKVSLWHGSGSAKTKGAKAQMLHRFMQQADSQLYLVGHLHDVVVLFDFRQRRHRGRIQLQKIAGAMSSSFLEYFGTYAETADLSPSSTMMARVILEPSGHWELTLR
jgi:predicted MPP superfamily phosphohydrolase